MITIQKQDVAQWVLAEYLATSHVVKEKLRLFERKYDQTWDEFSKDVIKGSQEDFDKWDDYIEWKAYRETSKDLAMKIEEVRRGNFEVA